MQTFYSDRKFNGKVLGIDNKMFVNGGGRDEYMHPSKPIKEDYVYDAKMKASGELDNLLDAGVPIAPEEDGRDGHFHKNVKEWEYYKTLFKLGDNWFEGIVNIAVIDKGKLFKDVTKIEDVTEAIMSSYGKNPKSQFLRTSSVNNSLSQNKEKSSSKKQFSLSDDNHKQKQLDIILKANPAENTYSTRVRTTEDILTFEEALNSDDYIDYKGEDFDESYPYSIADEAIETGKITVYSSYPIEQGILERPSKNVVSFNSNQMEGSDINEIFWIFQRNEIWKM